MRFSPREFAIGHDGSIVLLVDRGRAGAIAVLAVAPPSPKPDARFDLVLVLAASIVVIVLLARRLREWLVARRALIRRARHVGVRVGWFESATSIHRRCRLSIVANSCPTTNRLRALVLEVRGVVDVTVSRTPCPGVIAVRVWARGFRAQRVLADVTRLLERHGPTGVEYVVVRGGVP